jgi:hypothetical protein
MTAPSAVVAAKKGEHGFRVFLRKHERELVNIAVYAAFGMKNHAENEATSLLREYNDLPMLEKKRLDLEGTLPGGQK